jgi:AraC family transcriptional regulator
MSKKETLNYYQSKVKNLVSYIQNNLEKDLNVKTLAEQSNISFFHFHRIIKAYLGMPLGTYVNRLRLDTAAKLIKYSNENISEVALKIGYNDLSAFSKSFTREFGITPSEYKSNCDCIINSTIDFCYRHEKIEKYNISPKVKTIPARNVIFVEVKGEYGGEKCVEAWNLMVDFARANKIMSWNPEAFSIYYDDPEVVGVDNCVADYCLTIRKKIEANEIVKIKEVPCGKYLVFRYKGPYEKLWDVYDYMMENYIMLIGKYELRDAPMIEKYIKYSDKTKPENLITEICLPIN